MTQECRTELLSDYIDEDLEPATHQQIEEHIAVCGACHALVSDLRKVVRRAGALENPVPTPNLWPGIASRIGSHVSAIPRAEQRRAVRRRSVTFSVPQLMAAGIAMIALVGTAGWFGARAGNDENTAPIVAAEMPADVATLASVSFETRYDRAVVELMATLERERAYLNPSTIRVVEENLRLIDDAIARANAALAEDPESDYVRDHLERTVRQKLGLLRRVTEMASRS